MATGLVAIGTALGATTTTSAAAASLGLAAVGTAAAVGTSIYSAVQGRKQAKRATSALEAPSDKDIAQVRKSSELPEPDNKQSMMARLTNQKRKRRAAAGRQGTNISGGSILGGAPSTTSGTVLGG